MLNELCYIHSKLKSDEYMQIRFTDESYILSDKTDIVRKTHTGIFRIVRANGKIVSINPSRALWVSIVSKRSVYL